MDLVVKRLSFEEMIATHGYVAYTCVGVSMMPLLRERKDIVVIQPQKERPKKYDVLLYKRDGQYILHRVLKVLPNGGYLIAGDHNTFVERDITDEMILGKMTRIIRGGKSIYPTDWKYRLYVHLWVDFYPIRVTILFGKAVFRALIRMFTGRRQEKDVRNEE